MMKRRDLFKQLLSGGAGLGLLIPVKPATASAHINDPGEHPLSILERLNQKIQEYHYPVRLGNYRVHFTGFKSTPYQYAVVGQWLGWPTFYPTPAIRREQGFYYVNVPSGGAGRYHIGDMFNIGRCGISLEDFDIPEYTQSVLDRVEIGRQQLLDLLRQDGKISRFDRPIAVQTPLFR
jgi:hypothetical protein